MRVATGDHLLSFLADEANMYMGIALFARPSPPLDLASLLIWLMAMATVITASDWIGKKEVLPSEGMWILVC